MFKKEFKKLFGRISYFQKLQKQENGALWIPASLDALTSEL